MIIHLLNNIADYLLLMGLILIGFFIYMTFALAFTLLYLGVICVIASLVFGLTPEANGRTNK